jgi:hypothetical protein
MRRILLELPLVLGTAFGLLLFAYAVLGPPDVGFFEFYCPR